jgi:transposase, IS5 family
MAFASFMSLKVIHSMAATAANLALTTVLPQLLQGEERRAYVDRIYRGWSEAIPSRALKARDFTSRLYR